MVIVVDDGLATGASMRAAVVSLRRRKAGRIIAAAPVGSRDAVDRLAQECDEVIVPVVPEPFRAVGEHYADFRPVTDDEVVTILRRARIRESGG